jgi:sec-independent protein translocase protein TatB
VFNSVGWGEIAVLLVIGLFVFGPERLPKVARDAARTLRQFRQMAAGMREELRSELGPELADFDLRTLHPRTFVRKHLFEDDDPLLPPYFSRRTSFDKMLFDDDPETPSGPGELTRPRLSYDDTPAGAVAATKTPVPTQSPVLTKATLTTGRSQPPDAATSTAHGTAAHGAAAVATPFDAEAT